MIFNQPIYLDTHIVVWLYENKLSNFKQNLLEIMDNNALLVSPMVRLELQYLYEIKRINDNSDKILNELSQSIELTVCGKNWNDIVTIANAIDFTRDAFDRLIVAHAKLNNNYLISKDTSIRQNYSNTLCI